MDNKQCRIIDRTAILAVLCILIVIVYIIVLEGDTATCGVQIDNALSQYEECLADVTDSTEYCVDNLIDDLRGER